MTKSFASPKRGFLSRFLRSKKGDLNASNASLGPPEHEAEEYDDDASLAPDDGAGAPVDVGRRSMRSTASADAESTV